MTYRRTVLIVVLLISSTALGPVGQRAKTVRTTARETTRPTPRGERQGPILRIATPAYDDGYSTPRGGLISPTPPNPTLPNPRAVSNAVVKQLVMAPNSHEMTDWVFQWGQFVDHDLDLTGLASPAENFAIPMPADDPVFHTATMDFQRSKYDPTTGTGVGNPRQQVNEITSYLDASMIYGSDAGRATTLRTLSGGHLKTSAGNLLPLNTFGLPNGTGGPFDPAPVLRRRRRPSERAGRSDSRSHLVHARAQSAGRPDRRRQSGME